MVNYPITMTITFNDGATLHGRFAHIIKGGLAVEPTDDKPHIYPLSGIKTIIPDQKTKAPSHLQTQFTQRLQNDGYVWDKKHSTAAAGVILKRDSDGDFWFFGLEGEIMHNPEPLLSIKL